MPAPGDQHLNQGGQAISNPFEDVKPRISEYTVQEIATLQSRLEKQLGPEYISSRPGPGGQKVHYITGEKCIQLANEVFGFNGWSSSIMQIQVDYVDEDPVSRKVSLGLSVIVRVTLRDGTYHEDIGYGEMDNCKGKGAAFHKAKKEATTDALKRALRNFGNVLGNCIYDKAYLTKVVKVKTTTPKWDVDALHRHSDHIRVKKEAEALTSEGAKQSEPSDLKTLTSNDSSTETVTNTLAVGDFLDDEFDDFDETDFGDCNDPDSRPDEVVLPINTPSHRFKTTFSTNTSDSARGPNVSDQNQRLQAATIQAQNMPAPVRPFSGNHPPDINTSRFGPSPPQHQINTSSAYLGLARSHSGASGGTHMRPLQETVITPRSIQTVAPGLGRVLNQPSRTGPALASHSPAYQQKPAINSANESADGHGTAPAIEGGFFSARAATMLPEMRDNDGGLPILPGNLPAFNPHAESPSIRKTPGINHNQTMPLTKELKHVPGSTQTGPSTASGSTMANVVNPQLDVARRIGVPGSPSPMANRNVYKPPTMKRPYQGQGSARPPLGNLSTNEALQVTDGGGDVKRARMNGS